MRSDMRHWHSTPSISWLLTAAIAALSACSDDPSPVAPRLDPETDISAAVAPSAVQSASVDGDALSAAVAKRIPGFGGWFYDGNGELNVWMTDASSEESARAALADFVRDLPRSAHHRSTTFRVVIRRGQYDWRQLSAWRDLIDAAAADIPQLRSLDIDETRNRLVVGVSHAGALAAVRAKLVDLGVPDGPSITMLEPCDPYEKSCDEPPPPPDDPCGGDPSNPDPACQPPPEDGSGADPAPDPSQSCPSEVSCSVAPPSYNHTLNDVHSTIKGGIKISWYSPRLPGAERCTLGFVARHATWGNVFVTASHCDDVQGGLGTYRNFGQPSLNDVIGTEVYDPAYTRTGVWQCRYWPCRNSDAAFIQITTSSRSIGLGRIARPTNWAWPEEGNGPITIDQSRPTLRIIGEATLIVGDYVDKVGQYSGWTWDQVTHVCVRRYQGSPNGRFHHCQSTARYWLGPGDSGAPTFLWLGSDDVRLVGLHHSKAFFWGSVGKGGHYSPLSQIRKDLGSFATF